MCLTGTENTFVYLHPGNAWLRTAGRHQDMDNSRRRGVHPEQAGGRMQRQQCMLGRTKENGSQVVIHGGCLRRIYRPDQPHDGSRPDATAQRFSADLRTQLTPSPQWLIHRDSIFASYGVTPSALWTAAHCGYPE
ncbi:hypothetical protein GCM10012284_13490 [Mangrovihabitans endophyticus]|uniref:Uncharacterized protein n=1 Tax=Mangrovihabitans endophyticus TaxID=1751298 RepID=A0A8J3BVB7_9ACTN|nr:hypothetical protein GCM10012284_13490 [Mangrovihabitans endophyticus]